MPNKRTIKVLLPSSGSFSGSPSGDNEYDEACEKAIASQIPLGAKYISHKVERERVVRDWAVVTFEEDSD